MSLPCSRSCVYPAGAVFAAAVGAVAETCPLVWVSIQSESRAAGEAHSLPLPPLNAVPRHSRFSASPVQVNAAPAAKARFHLASEVEVLCARSEGLWSWLPIELIPAAVEAQVDAPARALLLPLPVGAALPPPARATSVKITL